MKMHMIKNSRITLKRIIIYDLLKQHRENVLQRMKIKVRLVLNETLNYIQHMVLLVSYRLFLTKTLWGKGENAGNQHVSS